MKPKIPRPPKTPVLINAAQLAIEHPDTFQRPPADEIQQLAPGCSVKICNGFERFWVVIQEANFPLFVGKLDNYLLFPNGLRFGGRLAFHADNVFEAIIRGGSTVSGGMPPQMEPNGEQ